jgi:hypothetical protein
VVQQADPAHPVQRFITDFVIGTVVDELLGIWWLCGNRRKRLSFDQDITVLVSDGRRSPYVLPKPYQRTKEGWDLSGGKRLSQLFDGEPRAA